MDKNTQLPVEVTEEIKLNAEDFANKHINGRAQPDVWEIVFKSHETAATAYATKLHQVEQENADLKRWKMEAVELLTKIHSYAHKHLEIKLGESTVDFVIAMAKERDELKRQNDKLKEKATGWRPLPADDAVQNWFEENIDKECSASSAIYKFRLWLESLQREFQIKRQQAIRLGLIEDEQPAAVSQDAHEKEIMMQAFAKVRQIFEGRQWVMEGRGSYPYNDDRYKEEVRYMYNEFDEVVKDTWANIKSKSVDYRKAIIAEYLEQPSAGREEDACDFAEWMRLNCISSQHGWVDALGKWDTTKGWYELFKQQKEKI